MIPLSGGPHRGHTALQLVQAAPHPTPVVGQSSAQKKLGFGTCSQPSFRSARVATANRLRACSITLVLWPRQLAEGRGPFHLPVSPPGSTVSLVS